MPRCAFGCSGTSRGSDFSKAHWQCIRYRNLTGSHGDLPRNSKLVAAEARAAQLARDLAEKLPGGQRRRSRATMSGHAMRTNGATWREEWPPGSLPGSTREQREAVRSGTESLGQPRSRHVAFCACRGLQSLQEEFQQQGAKLAMLEQTAAEGSHGIAASRAGVLRRGGG